MTVLVALWVSCAWARGGEPPVIPVGLDAYRQWDRWAYQRIGERAYMRSTYDRAGGNEGADASHFLYQKSDDFNVTLDVEGAGVLYFARYNHWHGSPWHYVVDGVDHVISESSTADPKHPSADSRFEPRDALPGGLSWTWATTKGADLMWIPVGFTKSFQMVYGRTHYGTGYYIYHQFVPGAKLSRAIESWDGKTPPGSDVLELLNRSGTDLSPTERVIEEAGTVSLPPGAKVTLANLRNGPAMLRMLELTIPREQAEALSNARLRVTWDRRPQPSIDAPVALFFGAGTLYNRDDREFLVKAFPVNIRFDSAAVHLACYFPMPFFRSAKIELIGTDRWMTNVNWRTRQVPYTGARNQVGYFHATYVDHANPVAGRDLILLDTRQAEGEWEWSGHFVGTSFIFSHNAVLSTLEGDPRFYFDDAMSPQGQGTGTEEWAGGGDYWGGENMTLPLVGHPVGARDAASAKSQEDKFESAYRFLLADLMPFGRNALITLEHGGTNESREHYQTVTYWYGLPGASVVKTDELNVGQTLDEAAHHYHSPAASEPYEVTSRYEWGVDHLQGREIFPAITKRGRVTTGESEFEMKLEPENWGVMLRRTLDYSFANQRAEVFVADVLSSPEWKSAGVWYTAGSNTCVYSNPKDELGASEHKAETSNRRFREEEFLIGREFTRGRKAIAVKVKFTPVEVELFPGRPFEKKGWSEIKYDCYCFVMREQGH